jgi:hypothetical protein
VALFAGKKPLNLPCPCNTNVAGATFFSLSGNKALSPDCRKKFGLKSALLIDSLPIPIFYHPLLFSVYLPKYFHHTGI